MHVLIIGAGLIGLTTAAEIALRGHRVSVVEQQPAPGMGTSFANGGQLSYSHAEPWANPRVIPYLLKSLQGGDTPIRWRPTHNAREWKWALKFAALCAMPLRHGQDMEAIFTLTRDSREAFHRLQQAIPMEIAHRACGTLHIYDSEAESERAWKQLSGLRRMGCEMHAMDRSTVLAWDPSLQHTRLQAAIFFPLDEVGDAHAWCDALAAWLAAQPGCEILYRRTITALHGYGHGWRASMTSASSMQAVEEVIEAQACVVTTGHACNNLLAPLGIKLPIQPLAGYSATYCPVDATLLPQASLTDNKAKIVASRIGDKLRVAGMGDLGRITPEWQQRRHHMLAEWTEANFPHLAGLPAQFWTGFRPATPSGLPIISGHPGHPGLYINAGHGPLGWTMAAGSAVWLADSMEGKPINPAMQRMRL
jgi:D-amino-acid dehydrogenase